MIKTPKDLSDLELAEALNRCTASTDGSWVGCPLVTGSCGDLWNEVDKRFTELARENAELREANERTLRMASLAVRHETVAINKLEEIAAIIVR